MVGGNVRLGGGGYIFTSAGVDLAVAYVIYRVFLNMSSHDSANAPKAWKGRVAVSHRPGSPLEICEEERPYLAAIKCWSEWRWLQRICHTERA